MAPPWSSVFSSALRTITKSGNTNTAMIARPAVSPATAVHATSSQRRSQARSESTASAASTRAKAKKR